MSTTRRCGLSGPGRYSLCLLLASLSLLSACVSSPEAPAPEVSAPEAPTPGSEESPPEVAEIRGPVPLPVRMVLLLPDPELPALPGTVSRTPPPSASARDAAVVEGAASMPAPEPPAPAAAPPVPDAPAAKAPDAPKPVPSSAPPKPAAPASASKPADPKPAAPSTGKTAPAPVPAKPAEPKPSAAAATPAVPAPTTATPAAPAPALAPAPASSARIVPEAAPAPGRTEEAVRGSPLELPFGGSGWVYLGETGGREGLKYESRKFDGSRAVFQFTAERPGEYLLRFQRQDPFSGDPENLVVKVIVREPEAPAPAGSPSRAAPGAASAGTPPAGPAASTPAAPAQAAAGPSASAGPASRSVGLPSSPAVGGTEAAPAADSPSPPAPRDLPSTPEELLRLAREDLAAGRIAGVLEVLDRYVALFPFGSDEAHYLYAKAYEQNTPYRDIKKAYANYRKVRDEWPRSPFWRESAERVTYIERHYFDIR